MPWWKSPSATAEATAETMEKHSYDDDYRFHDQALFLFLPSSFSSDFFVGAHTHTHNISM